MRGIRIGIRYDLKDKFSGGLRKIKERIGGVSDFQKKAKRQTADYFKSFNQGIKKSMPSLDNFKMKNVQLFDAIQEQVPFLGRLGPMLSNPFVLGAAAVVGMISVGQKLITHLNQISLNIEQNQLSIRSMFGVTGKELALVTALTLGISDVLKVETAELGKAANSLQKEYADTGLSIRGSLNLIKTGLQLTNGQLDIEEIKEYSSQMKNAGLNAQEFIALSVLGKRQGIFNDKAVDAVKEFNLRLKEMTPAARDALKGIGLSADEVLKGLNNGSLRTIDVLRRVSQAMASADTQARQTAIADLFGGAGEDAGVRFLLSLGKSNLSLKQMSVNMKDVIHRQDTQIALNEKIRLQQTRIADTMNPVRHQWENFKLQATELFYRVIANGIQTIKAGWSEVKPVMEIVWKILKIGITPAVFAASLAVKGFSIFWKQAGESLKAKWELTKRVFNWIGKGVDWISQKIDSDNLWDNMFRGMEVWENRIKVFFQDLVTFGQKTFELLAAGFSKDFIKAIALFNDLKSFKFRDADSLLPKRTDTKHSKVNLGFDDDLQKLKNPTIDSSKLVLTKFDELESSIKKSLGFSISRRDFNISDQFLRANRNTKNLSYQQMADQLKMKGVDLNSSELVKLNDFLLKHQDKEQSHLNVSSDPGGMLSQKNTPQKSVTLSIQNLNEGGIHIQNVESLDESEIEIEDKLIALLMRAVRSAEQDV